MRKSIFNRSFMQWWLSYIAILLLPIIATAIYHKQSLNRLSNEINRSYSLLVDQMKLSIDSNLSQMVYISQELSTSTNIDRLARTADDRYRADEVAFAVALQNELRDICALNETINNIYVFFPHSRMVLSTANSYRRPDLFVMMSEIGNADNEPDLYFETRSPFFDINSQYIMFYRKISPFIDESTPSILITIKLSSLERTLEASNISGSAGGGFSINTEDGREVSWGRIPDEENLTLIQSRSSVNSWSYVAYIPTHQYTKEIRYLQRALLSFLGMSIILGALLSYFITRRNYKPIDKLLSILAGRLGTKTDGDVFAQLENKLKAFIAKYDKLRDTQDDQKRSHALREVMQAVHTEYYLPYLKSAGVALTPGSFNFLLIRIDEVGEEFAEVDESDKETIDVVHFVVRNVLTELFEGEYSLECTDIDDDLLCIVHSLGDTGFGNLEEKLEIAQTFIKNNLGIFFSVIINSKADDLDRMYSECFRIAEYLTLMGKSGNLNSTESFKSDFDFEQASEGSKIYDLENKIFNYLTLGDFDSAKTYIDMFVKDFLSSGIALSSKAGNLISSITDILVNALPDLSDDELAALERLTSYRSISTYRHGVNELLDEIKISRAASDAEEYDDEINRVTTYINEQFSNPSLSIPLIADELGYSAKQLARIIKDGVGMRPLEYIQSLRLERAKTLLNSTELTVTQISEEVGFINSLALNRLFKKYEGISPSQFRDVQNR